MSQDAQVVALARTVRRQKLAMGGMGAVLVLLAGVGLGRGPAPAGEPQVREVTTYTAGGNRLYRIWSDGSIDYLIVDFANGSVEGIPGWARLEIDQTLSRDRMGNMIRAAGR